MNELLSKQGKSITLLAQLLLQTQPMGRLPAMQQIADEQAVSVGTVQSAMQYLQMANIVDVESRGRLGAFVQALDYLKLWTLANRRAMIGMLPMPYSRRVEGLATGLRWSFEDERFDVDMRFMRGSTARIQRLHAQQCDWVVTSRYAAETASVQGFDVQIILALGMGTYTVDHVLVLNGSETLQAGMRVGIDTFSADHAYVVRLLSRGIPVKFVEVDYSTSLDQLLRGEIDATVWTQHDLPVLPGHIHVQQVNNSFSTEAYFQQLGEAVIVGLKGSTAVAHVLKATLHVETLRTIQGDVLAGRRRPTY